MVYSKELVSICINNETSKDIIYDILGSFRCTNFIEIEGEDIDEYVKNDCKGGPYHIDGYNVFMNPNLEIKPKKNELEIYELHSNDKSRYGPVYIKYRSKIDYLEEILTSFPNVKIEKIGTFLDNRFCITFN